MTSAIRDGKQVCVLWRFSGTLIPDNIQEHICVIDLAIHAVVVQGDTPDGAAAREEQVRLRSGVAGLPISLQLDASGAGTGKARGPGQAQVRAATVPGSALVHTW